MFEFDECTHNLITVWCTYGLLEVITVSGIVKNMYVLMALVLVVAAAAGVIAYPALAASKNIQSVSTSNAVGEDNGPNIEVQEPSYKGSIAVPQTIQNSNLSEVQEQAMLKNLAKITSDNASRAALAKVNGTVLRVSLENENGYLVYSVIIKASNGTIFDVKVDAGNGKVLHISADDLENIQEVGAMHGAESAVEEESALEVEK
jgi:uncharacterized membrane protein YkoI